MDLSCFLRLSSGLSNALGRLHERGLVHKDVKPANVLVEPASGRAWLTGFGIASRLPRELPAPEVIAGSLAYMAPEQTGRMNRSVDSRSDLYSLGVTLYEMLAGALPFAAADTAEWVHCHIARKPGPPAAEGVPETVAAIVMKLLEKTPEERYQTAGGVEADLRRCLEAWKSNGRIEPFPLATHDVSARLAIPERLYGREREVRTLLDAYDRIAAGSTVELVLVSGWAGIGKSSLVNELHRTVVLPRGQFISGKFDQYQRDIPYSTFVQAFRTLIRHLLGRSAEEVAAWRLRLLEALDGNGRVITDLIPELERVIGGQPPVPDLPPREAQNRFHAVFRRLVGALAGADHPTVLFLDDLQWMDAASLKLLEHLVTSSDMGWLLVVGAYRDNEVGPSHPLMLMADAVRGSPTPVSEIFLGGLSLQDVSRLVSDALRCSAERVAPLARLVHAKTGGNPFFAIHFLTELHAEGLLELDARDAAWTWDLPRIEDKGYTDNVVDLMVGKLRRLPAATLTAMQRAACLGNSVEAAILALAEGRSPDQAEADLWEAARAGLVIERGGTIRFLHDRIQEAAYSMIPESERAEAHLLIGRRLLEGLSEEEVARRVFDVTGQLNRGVHLTTDAAERETLCRLNVLAGTRARAAIAYEAARSHLAQAAALLPADAWSTRYELCFDIRRDMAECEYLCGLFEEAESRFRELLDHADTALRSASVYALRLRLYQVAGRYREGVAVGTEALRLLGVEIPEDAEGLRTAAEAELALVPGLLAGRRIADLYDAPMVAEPEVAAAIGLLAETCPCAYIGKPEAMPLVTLKMLNLSLAHGNTAESCFAYSAYGLMAVSSYGRIDEGYEFSLMSLRLNEKLGDARRRGCLLHLHGDHVNFWRRPFATGFPYLEEGFQACLHVGDLVYASYLAFETVWQMLERGDALDDVLAGSEKYADFCRQSSNQPVLLTIQLERQFIAAWKAQTRDPSSLSDDRFDEDAAFAAIGQASFGCGVVFYHIMKQILAYASGHHEEALEAAGRAAPVLGAAMAMPIEATHHFYLALTAAALHAQVFPERQQELAGILDRELRSLALWAAHCPQNFSAGTRSWPPRPRASKGGTWRPRACTRRRRAPPGRTGSPPWRRWRTSWRPRSTSSAASTAWGRRARGTPGAATDAGAPSPR